MHVIDLSSSDQHELTPTTDTNESRKERNQADSMQHKIEARDVATQPGRVF